MISNFHTSASTGGEPSQRSSSPAASYSYTFGGMDNDETTLSQGRRSSAIKSHRKRWFRGTIGRGAKVHNSSNESTDSFSYSTDGSSIAMQSTGQSTVDSSSVDYSIPQMLQEKAKKKVLNQQPQLHPHPQCRPLSLSRGSIHSMSQQSLEYSTDGESSDFSFDGSALEGSVLIQQHLAEQERKKEEGEENAVLRRSNGNQHDDPKDNSITMKKNNPNARIQPMNDDIVDTDDDDDDCPDDESQQDLVLAQGRSKRIAQSSTNVYTSVQNKQQTENKNNRQRQKQHQKRRNQQSGIEDIFNDLQLPRWCCGGLACFL